MELDDISQLGRLNRCLPYAEDLFQPEQTIAGILDDLKGSMVEQDQDHAHPDDSSSESHQDHYHIGTHLKRLERCLRLKVAFTASELGEFLRLTYRLVLDQSLSAYTQVLMCWGSRFGGD